MVNNGLTIWKFSGAPKEFRHLSSHGGDEDWVLYCPKQALNFYWPYVLDRVLSGDEASYADGFGHVDYHVLANGDVVVIFAHA